MPLSSLESPVCNQEASLYFQVLPQTFSFCFLPCLKPEFCKPLGRLPKLGCFSLLTHEPQGSPLPIPKHFPFPKMPRIFQVKPSDYSASCFSSKWSSAFFSIIRDSSPKGPLSYSHPVLIIFGDFSIYTDIIQPFNVPFAWPSHRLVVDGNCTVS